jgi:recombinational DNA repair protein (RecF pathway)
MYTIHRTEGYVLKSSSQGEANRRIDLLTKELGLIRGTAQGVRYLKSKLRYSLTDFARVDIALVRGKDTWRTLQNTMTSLSICRPPRAWFSSEYFRS